MSKIVCNYRIVFLRAINDKSIGQNALIHGPQMVEKYADWNTEMLRIEKKYYDLVKIAK
ncbi:MAG: hypothetical protein CM15mP42_05820 [Methanobacteriota archaeon]|nr:MAG: hypothetical protein CM15mP42_05820 [Euryarchaeota archaeon]